MEPDLKGKTVLPDLQEPPFRRSGAEDVRPATAGTNESRFARLSPARLASAGAARHALGWTMTALGAALMAGGAVVMLRAF